MLVFNKKTDRQVTGGVVSMQAVHKCGGDECREHAGAYGESVKEKMIDNRQAVP